MRSPDVAIPLGPAWSSPFTPWPGTSAQVDRIDVATAVEVTG